MSTGNTSVYVHDRRSLAGIEVYGVGKIKVHHKITQNALWNELTAYPNSWEDYISR